MRHGILVRLFVSLAGRGVRAVRGVTIAIRCGNQPSCPARKASGQRRVKCNLTEQHPIAAGAMQVDSHKFRIDCETFRNLDHLIEYRWRGQ